MRTKCYTYPLRCYQMHCKFLYLLGIQEGSWSDKVYTQSCFGKYEGELACLTPIMTLFELKLLSSLYDVLFYELRSTRYMIVALLFISYFLPGQEIIFVSSYIHCTIAYPLQVKMKVKPSIHFNLASFSSLFVSLILFFFYQQFSIIIVFLCSNVPSHHFLPFKERHITHMCEE